MISTKKISSNEAQVNQSPVPISKDRKQAIDIALNECNSSQFAEMILGGRSHSTINQNSSFSLNS